MEQHIPDWPKFVMLGLMCLFFIFFIYWVGYDTGHTDACDGKRYGVRGVRDSGLPDSVTITGNTIHTSEPK